MRRAGGLPCSGQGYGEDIELASADVGPGERIEVIVVIPVKGIDGDRGDLRAIEKKCGRIGLKGWPHGSTLEIDGRAARDPTYVKPGVHSVKVRSPSGVELTKDGDVGAGEVVELEEPAGAELAIDATAQRPRPPPKKKTRAWVVPVVVMGALVVAGGVTAGVILGTQSASNRPLTGDLGTYPFSMFH